MFKSGQLDATILLEQAPEIEIIDGLVYITDRIGGLVIRRCFRPSTFLKTVQKFQRVAHDFATGGPGKVCPFPVDSGQRRA
jgi:hypothetical protein